MSTRFEKSTLTCDWTVVGSASFQMSPIYSAPYPRDEIKWHLQFYPSGVKEEGFITLCLVMDEPREPLKVNFNLGLVNNNGVLEDKYCILRNDHTFERKTGSSHFCQTKGLIRPEDLINGSHGLLSNRNLKMRCEIFYANQEKRPTTGGDPLLAFDTFRSLLFNGLHSDVVLKAEGKEIKAHKAILASASPVFRAMFEPNTKESREGVVDVQEISHEVLQTIVGFIYTGKVDTRDCSFDLLMGADFYDLRSLKAICEHELMSLTTEESAIETLIQSDIYNALELRDSAIDFISKNGKQMKKRKDWEEGIQRHPHLMLLFLTNYVDVTDWML